MRIVRALVERRLKQIHSKQKQVLPSPAVRVGAHESNKARRGFFTSVEARQLSEAQFRRRAYLNLFRVSEEGWPSSRLLRARKQPQKAGRARHKKSLCIFLNGRTAMCRKRHILNQTKLRDCRTSEMNATRSSVLIAGIDMTSIPDSS